MKGRFALLLLPLLLFVGSVSATEKKVAPDCTFNGKKLWGKVQFVDSFPDLKVKAVENFPDLKVKMVNSFPDKCGMWQSVDSFPELKIQLVDNFPDLTVKFVTSFPGLP